MILPRSLSRWILVGVIAFLGFGLISYRNASVWRERIAARDRSITALTQQSDSLTHLVGSLAAHADTVYEKHWLPSKLRIDTLTDSIPVPVEVVREVVKDADATIQACRVTVSECQKLAATEKARGDSLAEQVKDWKRVSKGPLLSFDGYAATDLQQHYYAGAEGRFNFWSLHVFGRAETRIDSIAPSYRVGVSIPF